MSESEYIHKLIEGDPIAFRNLLHDYQKRIFAVCYSYTGDSSAADDLAQEVFIEVHKSVKNFRGEAKLSTWMYRVATNKSLNWIRQNKKHLRSRSIQRFYENGSQEKADIEDQKQANPSEILIQNEYSNSIQIAIDSLPENQKTAFVLNKVEGLSYKKVAEIMDLSLSAVESLIHRARKNLQVKLKDLRNR